MTTAYRRISISDGVGFSEILDPKLKTNSLRICLMQKLSSKTAAACALAGGVITASNQKYPTNAAMNRQLHLLYGAGLGCTISSQGDLQIITIHASTIADRFALEGEAIFDKMTDIVTNCLVHPNVQDGAFQQTEFQIEKRDLLDRIQAEINEKRQYAIWQTQKTAYQGEPAALHPYGAYEDVESLTAADAYRAYQALLKTAKIEIFFVGPESKPELPKKLGAILKTDADRSASMAPFISPSPVKPQPALVREFLPVNQCKMVLVWKTTCTDRYALKLMTLILGGTPSAKLFMNVREKMSLCYYCAASFVESKQTLFVDCGIEAKNIEKTKEAILQQLDALKNGDISEDEMQNALMSVHNAMCGVGDTASSHIKWYLNQLFRGTQLTPEQEEAAYRRVTKDQVAAAARSMQLDTVYQMECEQQEEHANGND